MQGTGKQGDPARVSEGDESLEGGVSASGDRPSPRKATAEADVEAFLGRKVGGYEIERFLARGGMGLVFVGRDIRLGRRVAIKALPPAMISDASSRARLLREAKILATLSHPAVATIYGLESSEDVEFLVMELVEGKTLSERLRAGALSTSEALDTCAQIAAAVEAAHEAGVIHRDLKPGNVMCTPGGRIKVLDFGLARELQRAADVADTLPASQPSHPSGESSSSGLNFLMGTPGYMSPEQARAERLDERSDIFALGSILYECLTGRQAFPGGNVADVLVSILVKHPDYGLLPPDLPEEGRLALERCLAKEPDDRPRRVAEIHDSLVEARRRMRSSFFPRNVASSKGPTSELEPATEKPRSSPRETPSQTPAEPDSRLSKLRPLGLFLLGALTAAVLSVLLLNVRLPPPPLPPPEPVKSPAPLASSASARLPLRRFSIPFPGSRAQSDLSHLHLAISRDGSRVVFTSSKNGEAFELSSRRLDELEAKALPDTFDVESPCLSPDGSSIAYVDGSVLRKRRVSGGQAIDLAPHPAVGGPRWGLGETLWITPAWSGVARVAEGGGEAQYANRKSPERGENAFFLAEPSPNGNLVFYTVWTVKDTTRIDVLDVGSGKSHTVVENASTPRIARTPRGMFLLWERKGSVVAAAFDEEKQRINGPEHAIADEVLTDEANFDAKYDVSDDGTFVYFPGPIFHSEMRLSWISEDKKPVNALEDKEPFADPRLSADGKRVSVIQRRRMFIAYIYDLARGTKERLSFDADVSAGAISPEGDKYVFASNRDGGYTLWLRDLRNGSEKKLHSVGTHLPHQFVWAPDSKKIAFTVPDDDASVSHIWLVSLELEPHAARWTSGRVGDETFPVFSSNGKWIAYAETSEGAQQIFLRPVADPSQKKQLTTTGGTEPDFSGDGKTIYYRNGRQLVALPFSPDEGKAMGAPRVLLDRRFGQSDVDLRSYAVSPDGRVLIIEQATDGYAVPHMNVIQSWDSALP